jgi:hypothetical protein
MLLEIGVTVRDGVRSYKLTRGDVSLETPDGATIPMLSTEEYRKVEGSVQALQNREKVQRDSIKLLSAQCPPGLPNRVLRRSQFSRDGVG